MGAFKLPDRGHSRFPHWTILWREITICSRPSYGDTIPERRFPPAEVEDRMQAGLDAWDEPRVICIRLQDSRVRFVANFQTSSPHLLLLSGSNRRLCDLEG